MLEGNFWPTEVGKAPGVWAEGTPPELEVEGWVWAWWG